MFEKSSGDEAVDLNRHMLFVRLWIQLLQNKQQQQKEYGIYLLVSVIKIALY